MATSKRLWCVIQEGGSSREAYASFYDTYADAEGARRGHAEATYRSTPPIPVEGVEEAGRWVVSEAELREFAERVRKAEYA